jgi:hypothetical protein
MSSQISSAPRQPQRSLSQIPYRHYASEYRELRRTAQRRSPPDFELITSLLQPYQSRDAVLRMNGRFAPGPDVPWKSVVDSNVWSGRASQEVFVDLTSAVLHQCIRSLIGARCAPDHHGYQRACLLISGQASTGHLGHQCSHAPGRPILHLFLSSRRPRRVNGVGLCHRLSFQ